MNDESDQEPEHESDDELLVRSKAGDRAAFSELYERHRGQAQRFATSLTRDPMRAGDLVSDAFIKVMTLVDQGRGPVSNFGAYLRQTIRTTHIDQLRGRRRETLVDDVALVSDAAAPGQDPADQQAEANLVTRAFLALPDRWREVLWYTEVHDEPHDLVAARFGIKKNAVGALCFRAREGLRQQYLAEHLAIHPDAECQIYAPQIPAYLRGQLSPTKTTLLEKHLQTCAYCPAAVQELHKLSSSLGAVVAPAVVFGSGLGLGHGGSVGAKAGAVLWKLGVTATGVAVAVTAVLVLRSEPANPQETSAPAAIPTPSLHPRPAPIRPSPRPQRPRPSPSVTPTLAPTTPTLTPPPTQPPTPPPSTPTPTASLAPVLVNTVHTAQATSAEMVTSAGPGSQRLQVTIYVGNASGFRLKSSDDWSCRDLASTSEQVSVSCAAPAGEVSGRGLVFEVAVVDPDRPARGEVALDAAGETLRQGFAIQP